MCVSFSLVAVSTLVLLEMVHLACFATPAAAGSHAAPEARKGKHIGNVTCASAHHRHAHARSFRGFSPSCPVRLATAGQCLCAVLLGHWPSQASPPAIPRRCARQLSARLPFCLPPDLPFTSRPIKSWRAMKMNRSCSVPWTSAMRWVLRKYTTARAVQSAVGAVRCGVVAARRSGWEAGAPYMS